LTVVAEVVRNGFVESVHHGRVVAVDISTGRILLSVGDHRAPIFPRSALKPLQTLAMLRKGWEPDDDEHVAIACASHSGEPEHVDVVRRILATVGLGDEALDNTPGWPLDEDAARALVRAGAGADKVHHNCSGKHGGMVATCVAADWPVAGYRDPQHPLQVATRAAIEDVAAEAVAATAIDGCGAPAFALSLKATASALAALVTARAGTRERRVADAMRAHPFLVGGTGRDVTRLMSSLDGFLVKDGAEGVAAAATKDGVGIAVKIDDGSGRARTPVLMAVLRRLGYDVNGVAPLATTPVLGHGERVGEVRAAGDLSGP
jgi:L-asparaginase II